MWNIFFMEINYSVIPNSTDRKSIQPKEEKLFQFNIISWTKKWNNDLPECFQKAFVKYNCWKQDYIPFFPCSPNVTVPSWQLPCDAQVSGFYLTNYKGEDHCLFLWHLKIPEFNCILILYQKNIAVLKER